MTVLIESLALQAARLYAEGLTFYEISKQLKISKDNVGKLIREGILSLADMKSAAPEIYQENSYQAPNSHKPVSNKKADSPRKKAYKLVEERPRMSTLARARVVVTIEFDDLRRLCHYQKGGRCWEMRRRCDLDSCPYIWK